MMRFRSKQTILRRYQVLGFIVWRHEELHRLTWQAYETRGQHRHEIRRVEDRRRDQGLDLIPTPFLGVVTYRFGLADPAAQIHLPFKCTPWGYSCFRGGA
jgi:5-hydroxyisourate hydrolase-like protein (transthyretin family)